MKMPPPSWDFFFPDHASPSQEATASPDRSSMSGRPAASASSSAADAGRAPPATAAKREPSLVRKTPAVVTTTGSPKAVGYIAIGEPAGGSSGAVQRAPPSFETRSPADDETISAVRPSGARTAASDADAGIASRDTFRTSRPDASQTPLSSPAKDRKK